MAFASAEFVALCQSQIMLLTRALGASSTVVYLAEQAKDGMGLSLVPLVAYPETANVWARLTESLALMAQQGPTGEDAPREETMTTLGEREPGSRPDPEPEANGDGAAGVAPTINPVSSPLSMRSTPPPVSHDAGVTRQSLPDSATVIPPLVLPLMHEGVALGMLVSNRETLAWNRDEQQQAEQAAKTLALAWVLEQRGQWLQQQLQQRHLTQASQSETFHDLLHQFRNPLTALQTFGRLLVKRIPADDPNQPIAEGIVRESLRLQDLATTFDETIAQGDESLENPMATPSVGGLLLPGRDLTPGEDLPTEDITLSGARASREPLGTDALASTSRLGRMVRVGGKMSEVVRPLLQSAAAIAQERHLTLIPCWQDGLDPVWLDPAALSEVVSNLLDNALKYAPSGAWIWVLDGLEKTVAGQPFQGLAVGDTGGGIPLADQPHIFERHFRGVQAEGILPGTGLGLAIAKELMTAMGGHLDLISPVPPDLWPIEVQAAPQGPGTLFLLWLPMASEEVARVAESA